jgi:hypothetical protein
VLSASQVHNDADFSVDGVDIAQVRLSCFLVRQEEEETDYRLQLSEVSIIRVHQLRTYRMKLEMGLDMLMCDYGSIQRMMNLVKRVVSSESSLFSL